ncbi:hypothetical protein ZPR_2678 [Zunongwangia profunda SM-A87]|uniref:Uncharacterized protein n=1 Tax=Zunongwangia profunda (strain DSM 18752 / CCTCC AB 206139 / SM-A87) TaxID=655815 RepID=D5BFA2_ZUNPS|nr:hypothetical protein ZPR_2678 [Zunongwangia profunda SM-A87]|tara:strand:+ start:237 stop:362 length:126 start_codon:yes stop_codon:yes gene_type:complete
MLKSDLQKPKEIQYIDLGGAILSLIVAIWTIYQVWKNSKED